MEETEEVSTIVLIMGIRGRHLWGKKIRSCSQLVLMDQSTEPVPATDTGGSRVEPRTNGSDRIGHSEVEPVVRTRKVVVVDEFGEHGCEMSPVDNEQPVEAFPARRRQIPYLWDLLRSRSGWSI